MNNIRNLFWRILGINYNALLLKLDYTLLKKDPYTQKGIGTYDNGAKVWRWTNAPLIIGKYCSIAYDVNFIVDEGFHKASQISNYTFINSLNKDDFQDITITQREGLIVGNDVWIGLGAFIMPGVKIGNGAIIAANSVVTKDVPDYAVVAGSPAKISRMKYDNETILKFNKIAWWDWESSILENRKLDFYHLSVQEFVEKYGN